MIDSVAKPKPPKGSSYVLKTSLLKQALEDAGVECHVDLDYWIPQGGGSIFEAEYWLPNENVPYPRVYIRAGVVPTDSYESAMNAMVSTVLPAFIQWIRRILALPEQSPELHLKPYFNATYTETGLNITNEPVYKRPRSR